MTPATSNEILDLLGEEVDPLVVQRVADTGASLEEIAEAIATLEPERFGGLHELPSSQRVADVRAILEDRSEPASNGSVRVFLI